MPHVVLVGDSILDNGSYTRGGPDVVSQVRALLPSGWKATLVALDGSTQLRLVEPWAEIHRAELEHDRVLLQSGQPPGKIDRLK